MKPFHTHMCRSLALASGSLLAAGAAHAQYQGDVDRSFSRAPKSCAEVRWSESVLQKYPSIPDACQSIQMRNGKSYAMLGGTVEEIKNDGAKVRVDLEQGGTIMLSPPSTDMTLYVNGEKATFGSLREGQELNFYIPEDRFQAEFPGVGGMAPVIVPIGVVTITTPAAGGGTSAGTSMGSGTTTPSAADASAPTGGTLVLIPLAQMSVADEARSDGCWATLYGKPDFNGDSLTLIGPLEMQRMVGPFGFDWDDKVDSIKAGPRATVTIYDNEGYADKSARILPGKSVPEISGRMGLFEDVESMKVRCQ